MKSLKIFFFYITFFISSLSFAQFNWATIGIDGLTCSACSRSVEMSIRKLKFVDSVAMNLERTEGKIIFKKGEKVEIDKISKAVTDAGFSLRSLYAGINIESIKISTDYCWTYENCTYHFIKVPESKELKGMITLKFIGEKYMSHKEYKDWKTFCKNSCSYPTSPTVTNSKSYYVSLL